MSTRDRSETIEFTVKFEINYDYNEDVNLREESIESIHSILDHIKNSSVTGCGYDVECVGVKRN